MADRPIIFSGPMVRALAAGRKTQTRHLASSPLRRVEVGDRLWVKEALSCGGVFSDVVEVRYKAHERASHTEFVEQVPIAKVTKLEKLPRWPKYRPSIHMPRWASRLTLIVEAVRVEQLQAITEEDAIAEGLTWDALLEAWNATGDPNWPRRTDPRASYAGLWNSLHEEEGQRWQDDPEVLALNFRVVRGNIDQIGERADIAHHDGAPS